MGEEKEIKKITEPLCDERTVGVSSFLIDVN